MSNESGSGPPDAASTPADKPAATLQEVASLALHAKPRSALRAFLRTEASGGIVLAVAALAGIAIANSPLAPLYEDALALHLGPLSLLHWIDDGAMALFFLLVGLEIKRELVDGHLARWSDRALPAVAALSGMAVPAAVYLAIAGAVPGLARGWAIPSATDIAFAIGVTALLGRRVPTSLKLFLTAVAIVDDMGAIVVIALFYASGLNPAALAAAAGIAAVMLALNRAGVVRLAPYLALAVLLWAAVWMSGLHATIAGVIAASLIPLRRSPGAPDAEGSPLHRLEHALHPYVVYGVVPLFGFANAGVPLGGVGPGTLVQPLCLGIAAGLFLGKQAGVTAAVWAADRTGLARRPRGASWAQLWGIAMLCGIGFTMSLFIGGLAFDDPTLAREVKLGVLAGSLLSALAGSAVLYLAGRHRAQG